MPSLSTLRPSTTPLSLRHLCTFRRAPTAGIANSNMPAVPRPSYRASHIVDANTQRTSEPCVTSGSPTAKRLSRHHQRHRGSRLAKRIPPGSWDSHMHVVDPDRYPLDPAAVYRPRAHSLYDALSFESSVCLDNVVIVQPSIYGHDNSCLLNALRKLGSRRARGVVSFDPATTSAVQLRQWHAMGVRGARLNLKSSDTAMDPAQLESILTQYADAVRPLGWVVQVYVPMSLVDVLEMIVPRLGVRFCIDHLGHPCFDKASSRDPYQLRGFPALVRLLQAGQTFVKLSAPYRTSVADNHNDIEPVTRELLRLAGKSRLVFGTDWPHTRFEGLDIRPWMETVLDWCGDDEYLIQRLFKNNAEELWGVEA